MGPLEIQEEMSQGSNNANDKFCEAEANLDSHLKFLNLHTDKESRKEEICIETTNDQNMSNFQTEIKMKEAEILRYKKAVTKMEMMMRSKGILHSSLLQNNFLEAIAAVKVENAILKNELDAEKLSRQVVETLLKDTTLERNHLRKSVANTLKDSSMSLQQLSFELETCKLRELEGLEQIKSLSSLLNVERIQFQRQLHETKLFFENSAIERSALTHKAIKDPINHQHTSSVDGQLARLTHNPAESKEDTTVLQVTVLPSKNLNRKEIENTAFNEEELQKMREENESLRAQAMRCKELEKEIALLQHQLTERECCALEDLNKKIDFLKSENSVLLEENKRLSVELSESLQKTVSSEDALRVKNKMLDSQNDTIKELKVTVSDFKKQLLEKTSAFQVRETDFRRQLQEEVDQIQALQTEVAEQDIIISELEEDLSGQKQAKEAAENAKASLQKSVIEKDDMLRYIEKEIERVKDLYEGREILMNSEKNKALESLQLLERENATLQSECDDLVKETKDFKEKEQSLRDALDNQQKEKAKLMTDLMSATSALNAQNLAQEKMKDLYNAKVNQLCKALEELRDVSG